jgi:hypothetical protein
MTKRERLCRQCHERPARFRSRGSRSDGRVRADRDHELCFQCHRALRNRTRVVEAGPSPAEWHGGFPSGAHQTVPAWAGVEEPRED